MANSDGQSIEQGDTPGIDAIDDALTSLYGKNGGPQTANCSNTFLDEIQPLEGIRVFQRALPLPHWHYVTYGFSDLDGQQSDRDGVSGWGFELTFRVRTGENETQAPIWAFALLQNIAHYIFTSGRAFKHGDQMAVNGPIRVGDATKLCTLALMRDPELPPIVTECGQVDFLQVIGITADEEAAAKRWNAAALLEVFLPHMPLWITDLRRTTCLNNTDVLREVAEGTLRDGSSSGILYVDRLEIRQRKRLMRGVVTEVVLGARLVPEITAMLALRLPYDEMFLIAGHAWTAIFMPALDNAINLNDATVTIGLNSEGLLAFINTLKGIEGVYDVAELPSVRWCVEKTVMRNPQGEVIETIG
jgi:hypothetical protein